MSERADPIDTHVGRRLRLRRTLLGWSQEKLAKAMGLTFQQVQKYERGANRMGSARLFRMSRVLDVPVNWFFEELPEDMRVTIPGMGEEPAEPFETEVMNRKESLELLRAYFSVEDQRVRRKIMDLVKSLAVMGDDGSDEGEA